MKNLTIISLTMTYLLAASLVLPARADTPKFKMTTDVPDNVLIPDEVDTRLGTLKFFDGVPTKETAAKVWDQLDFQRAVESMILTTPAASLSGFRRGIREFGPCYVHRHSQDPCSQLRHSGNQRRNPPLLRRELAEESRVCQTPSHAVALRKSSQL